MKSIVLAFAAILAIFVVSPAQSQVKAQRLYTGAVMLSHCVNQSEYRLICLGYLSGIFDTHGVFVGSGMPRFFCAKDVNAERLREIFTKYVSDDPRRNELAAASLALNAFKGAFPCNPK